MGYIDYAGYLSFKDGVNQKYARRFYNRMYWLIDYLNWMITNYSTIVTKHDRVVQIPYKLVKKQNQHIWYIALSKMADKGKRTVIAEIHLDGNVYGASGFIYGNNSYMRIYDEVKSEEIPVANVFDTLSLSYAFYPYMYFSKRLIRAPKDLFVYVICIYVASTTPIPITDRWVNVSSENNSELFNKNIKRFRKGLPVLRIFDGVSPETQRDFVLHYMSQSRIGYGYIGVDCITLKKLCAAKINFMFYTGKIDINTYLQGTPKDLLEILRETFTGYIPQSKFKLEMVDVFDWTSRNLASPQRLKQKKRYIALHKRKRKRSTNKKSSINERSKKKIKIK